MEAGRIHGLLYPAYATQDAPGQGGLEMAMQSTMRWGDGVQRLERRGDRDAASH
jgi:hypothetical protein